MKHKLLKIANELNELLLHSDVNGYIEFHRFKDRNIAVKLTHINKSYEYNNKNITIYNFEDEEDVLEKVKKIKRVIAGEELINE